MSFIGRNKRLDMLKGIACIGIVFVHRSFPGLFGDIISCFARAGVAIFFLISGYYSFGISSNKCMKKLLRTVKLLAVSMCFYLIWESFIRWYGSGFISVQQWFSGYLLKPETIFQVLFLDLDSVAGHLWFLFALVRCYLIYYVLLKFRMDQKYLVISCLCLIAAFTLECFYPENTLLYRNGWLYGFGFFSFGLFVSKLKMSDKRTNSWLINLLLVTGSVMIVFEYFLFGERQMFFGTILLSTSLFVKTIENPDVKNKAEMFLNIIGSKYSTNIYIIHWSICELFIKFGKEGVFYKIKFYNWLAPILVLLSSLFCAYTIEILNKKIKGVYGVKKK